MFCLLWEGAAGGQHLFLWSVPKFRCAVKAMSGQEGDLSGHLQCCPAMGFLPLAGVRVYITSRWWPEEDMITLMA